MDDLCCCGCGNQVEAGRRAHVCTITDKCLFTGYCLASEDKGPCRRCVGMKDASPDVTGRPESKDSNAESKACITCGGYVDAEDAVKVLVI